MRFFDDETGEVVTVADMRPGERDRIVRAIDSACRTLYREGVVRRDGEVSLGLPRRTYLPFLWSQACGTGEVCPLLPELQYVGVRVFLDEKMRP